jgi:peroxiredoxin
MRKRKVVVDTLTVITALVIGVSFWYIVAENRRLAQQAGIARPSPQEPVAVRGLLVGDQMPSVLAYDRDGADVDLAEIVADSRVLVFFTTTCEFCRKAAAGWNELAASLSARGTSLLGVSFDSAEDTNEFVRSEGILWPVVRVTSSERRRVLDINTVPRTVVLSTSGQVVGLWRGPLSANEIVDVLSEVSVPHLQELPSDHERARHQ